MHTIISSRLKFTEHHLARTITINNFTTETETWTRTIFYEFFLFFPILFQIERESFNYSIIQCCCFWFFLLQIFGFSLIWCSPKGQESIKHRDTERKQRKQQIVQTMHKQIWSPMNPPTNCCDLLQSIEDIGRGRRRWVVFWWNICCHTHLQHIWNSYI